MPICIECRFPVSQLYHVLHSSKQSKKTLPSAAASEKTTPSIPSATPKTRNDGFAGIASAGVGDVYRHLLFNRLGRDDDELDPSILRLGTLLLLFDVYLTWTYIEALPASLESGSPVPHLPILFQYAFYLLLCALKTAAQHLTIRWLARQLELGILQHQHRRQPSNQDGAYSVGSSGQSTPETTTSTSPRAVSNGITTALFYDDAKNDSEGWNVGRSVARGVEWAVALQNLEALRILLGCGYLSAVGLVAAGAAARWIVAAMTLGVVGLGAAV
ncbi:MAG: hypothetical protein Q9191_005088 [Dirinaria sp. TL-2023a]